MLLAEAAGPSAQLAALTAELKRLEQKRRRLDNAFSDGDLPRAPWLARIAEITAREKQIRQSCAALAVASPEPIDPGEVAKALLNLPHLFALLAAEEQKMVLQGLLERVEAGPDGRVGLTLRHFTPLPASRFANARPAFDSINGTGLRPGVSFQAPLEQRDDGGLAAADRPHQE